MNTLRKNPVCSAQGGFTLIELMVSAVIGLIVLMAVSYAFIGGRHAYVLNSELMRMQENARAALETIRREMRMAGFHGCGEMSQLSAGVASATEMTRLTNGLHVDDTTYADLIPVMADGNPSVGLEIHGVAANAGVANITADFDSSASSVTVDTPAEQAARLNDAPRVRASDCKAGVILGRTGASASAIGVSGPGGDVTQIERGGQVYALALPRAFRLKLNPEDVYEGASVPIASLYYNEGGLSVADNLEELARGVEAFRVCVMDERPGGTKRMVRWQEANDEVKKLATQAQVDLVLVSFRRDVLPEAVTYQPQLCGDYDDVSYAMTDRRLRRLFSASMSLRNKITNVNQGKEAHDSAAD
jgi:type IV pilus assembly protein PilW